MASPIKVGIIRCDTHGVYYGPLMAPHDPLKLRTPVPVEADPPYSWQNGATHYYFYQFCADPTLLTVEAVDGFEIVKVWDVDRASAEQFAGLLDSRPRVCNSFAEVSDDVDLVFIADCNEDGSDHLELATPGLKKGVPTFIDKPLANEMKDVYAILDLAQTSQAPVFSASILRHIPGAFQFRSRLPEIGGADSGFIRGGSCHIAGAIHTVSLAQAVFGNGIEEVRCTGPKDLGIVFLSWGERDDRPRSGVVLHHAVKEYYHCASHVSAYGKDGAILQKNNINDWNFPYGAAHVLRLVRHMVKAGEVDDTMNDMIEAVAVVNAARLSQQNGSRPVQLTEITRD